MTDPPAPRWADQPTFLLQLARADLLGDPDVVHPTLSAFRGDDAVCLITLRPFDAGAHHDAILEAAALACGLGADRLALSLSGRAWSTEDPVIPVVDGVGDLRQRIVIVHTADAAAGPDAVSVDAHVTPIHVGCDGSVGIGATLDLGPGHGWVPQALGLWVTGVAAGHLPPAAAEEVAEQVLGCLLRGHRVAWGSGEAGRLRDLGVDVTGPVPGLVVDDGGTGEPHLGDAA